MKEESKYYTPEIEEFHVGFEYESLQDPRLPEKDSSWEQNTIDDEWDLKTFIGYYCGDHIEVRVKHLDREDIESLGFEDYKHSSCDWYKLEKRVEDNFSSYGYWNCFRLLHSYTDEGIKIIAYEHSFNGDENVLFAGKVKNKSELKRILKQIGI